MYKSFFGFREKPFHVTADPTFLYPSRHHEEAMAHLMYGIQERLGFLLITGEVGTGKTTLAKALVEKLAAPTQTALILNPALSGTQLLRAILIDFGAPSPTPSGKPTTLPSTRGELLQSIERFLIQLAHSGGMAVLIIDEAQALAPATLEQIRLLSNVETSKAKLLQIILIGQPELANRLENSFKLRALHQRIAVRYHIPPLDPSEVTSYIQHRLEIAGSDGSTQFGSDAIERIAQISGGIPRRINILCDQVLLAAFVQETKQIDLSIVQSAESAMVSGVASGAVPTRTLQPGGIA